MNSTIRTRAAMLLAGAAFLVAPLLLPGAAVPSYAKMPLEITGTIPPEPTATTAPSPTPVVNPTAEPVVTLSSAVPAAEITDPFVTLAGCTTCGAPGQIVEITSIVGNNTRVDAVNVQTRLNLPPTLEFVEAVSSRGTVINNGNAIVLDFGTLRAGERITVVYRLRIKSEATGEFPVSVSLSTTSQGQDTSNDATLLRCEVCAVALPVTGAVSDNGATWMLLTLGAIMIASSAALRRRQAK